MTFFVTLSGASQPYEVYAGRTATDDYLIGKSHAGAVAYRALDAGGDGRTRLLVDATGWLDSLPLAGTATLSGTTLQLPRTGVLNVDGTEMSGADQLAIAAMVVAEMAAILAVDKEARLAVDQGSNVKRIEGDGSSVEFWRPTSAADCTASVLPTIVSRLLGTLLGGGASTPATAGFSSGTSCRSSFDSCDAFERTGPF